MSAFGWLEKIVHSGFSAGSAKGMVGDVQTGLTAAGTNQATAVAITVETNGFTTVASGTGAILPNFLAIGDTVSVFNGGANALLVYPPTAGTIGTGAANASFSVGAGKAATFTNLGGNAFVPMLSA